MSVGRPKHEIARKPCGDTCAYVFIVRVTLASQTNTLIQGRNRTRPCSCTFQFKYAFIVNCATNKYICAFQAEQACCHRPCSPHVISFQLLCVHVTCRQALQPLRSSYLRVTSYVTHRVRIKHCCLFASTFRTFTDFSVFPSLQLVRHNA